MTQNSQYDYIPYAELPYGVPCSAIDLKYVFCRVRGQRVDAYAIYILGAEHGQVAHLSELVDMTTLEEPRFFELPVD